jgi:hypothetical protein
MSYKVVVPCVIAQDREGHSHHYYDAAIIGWLSDSQAAHFLAEGLVEKVSGTASDDGPPAKTAPKADWVTFAVSKGADADEAEALTKQELVELYGG